MSLYVLAPGGQQVRINGAAASGQSLINDAQRETHAQHRGPNHRARRPRETHSGQPGSGLLPGLPAPMKPPVRTSVNMTFVESLKSTSNAFPFYSPSLLSKLGTYRMASLCKAPVA